MSTGGVSTIRPSTMQSTGYLARLAENGTFIQASRVSVPPKFVYGTQDGGRALPAPRTQPFAVPKTGIPMIDQRVSSLTRFGPQAVKRSARSTIVHGLVGLAVGLPLSFLASKTVLKKALSQAWKQKAAIAGGVILTGLLGAGLGFARSLFSNMNELRHIVLGRQ